MEKRRIFLNEDISINILYKKFEQTKTVKTRVLSVLKEKFPDRLHQDIWTPSSLA